MDIRKTSPADLETITEFNIALALESESKVLKRSVVLSGIQSLLDNPHKGFYLIAEDDGVPLGQILITREWSDWRDGYFWWIQSVYVIPEARRQGIFWALHQRGTELARSADPPGGGPVCGLRLYVDAENGSAWKVYRKLGLGETSYQVLEDDWN